jgi:hypothetical protein
MNRNVSAQISYDRLNKGVDVRDPSTANFLIDSTDRFNYNQTTVYPGLADVSGNTSANFLINKLGQNLFTGFFTRFATTEVELAWNLPNVSPLYSNGNMTPSYSADENLGNNTTGLVMQLVGGGTVYVNGITIARGNYTVAQALAALVTALNTAVSGLSGSPVFSISASTVNFGKQRLSVTGGYNFNFFRRVPMANLPNQGVTYLNLAQALGFLVYDTQATATTALTGGFNYNFASNPNLNLFNYIDIGSPQMASQQKVKDGSTSSFDSNDTIYRWVFANDETSPVTYDTLGYPIVQGYLPFNSRRYLAFPKQIRWDPSSPLSQLQFQITTDKSQTLTYKAGLDSCEFRMLILISEV